MSRTYHHLSPEDRAVIMIERRNGRSLRSIARLLGRSPSTVSRELKRAGGGSYETTLAAEGYRERRSASRRRRLLAPGTTLYQYVHDRLVYFRWSPQQIAARLREMPMAAAGSDRNIINFPPEHVDASLDPSGDRVAMQAILEDKRHPHWERREEG